MDPRNLLNIIIGLAIIPLALSVLFKKPYKKANVVFSIISLSGTLWAFSIVLFRESTTLEDALFWDKLIYLTGTTIPALFFYFSKIFPTERRVSPLIKWALIISTLFFLFSIFFTNLFIQDVHITDEGNGVDLGPLYLVWTCWFGIFMFFALVNLYRTYCTERGSKKVQVKYMLLACLPTAIGSLFPNVIFPLFGNYKYIWIGPSTLVAMLSIIAYAMIRYRFFGIRFILGKVLYCIFTASIHLIFFYLIFFLQIKIWRDIFVPEALISSLLVAVIYISFYGKFDEKLRRFFEKTLIYAEYDPVEIMENLGEIMRSEQDLEKAVNKMLTLIKQSLDSQKVGMVLFERNRTKVAYKNLSGIDLSAEDYVVLSQFSLEKPFVYDEIFSQESLKKDKTLSKVLKLMKKAEIAVLVPLPAKERIRGFVLIGYKKNREAYTVQDINLLQNFVSNLSEVVRKFIITSEDVNLALKTFSSPHLLKGSNLLRLKQVQRLSEEKDISKVDALKDIIASSIKYFKPENDKKRRTMARLKYEILRMIAYEGATESQIMWDLGFDVYTRSVEEKLQEQRKPRFRLKDASEYSATSDRSFKRLKKDAVEMLRWRLEEGEEN